MSDQDLRRPAETIYKAELDALAKSDDALRPEGWHLSPQAAVTYLLGGKTKDGTEISPKYIGNRRLVETAVATLATDRALLLLGVPGTAKSWVSEHLAMKTRSAMAGTMPNCWPRGRRNRRWLPRR